jgi:high affinity Mn2+ porin
MITRAKTALVALATTFIFAVAAQAETAPAPSQPKVDQTRFDLAKLDLPEIDFHWQATFVDQFHPAFRSPYQGANSLNRGARGNETFDATLYLGVRPWAGAELWINPEIDQGFGLSNTLGVAGFPSGEAYKVGKAHTYYRTPRMFLRQTVNLGGESQAVDADLNIMAGKQTDNRLVFTVGKFSVPDIFDISSVAHDPRNDFMNWSIVDAGSFDYAADAWGYTPGAAAELYWKPWAARVAVMDMSNVPNSTRWDTHLGQVQFIAELERDWTVKDMAGSVRLTGYVSRGRMGKFTDAVAEAALSGQPADTAVVRRYANRPGFSVAVDQQLTTDVTAFARMGAADPRHETFEFTDIDSTASAGVSVKGKAWGRADDTFGVAGVVNRIGVAHRGYLNAGGLGVTVGDGKLPHYGDERDLEAYYKVTVAKGAAVSLDYQYIDNPAYNRDRGPVSILGVRLHWQK